MSVDPNIVAAIIVAVPAFAGAILSVVQFFKIQELHVLINSRLSQLLEATGNAREAKGRREGAEPHSEK